MNPELLTRFRQSLLALADAQAEASRLYDVLEETATDPAELEEALTLWQTTHSQPSNR